MSREENVYASYLTHHGIKGQRWGVRRFQKKDGSLTPAGKNRLKNTNDDVDSHDDYKRAHDRTSVKTMSDKELRDRLNRLNMERQYSSLTKEETNKGKQYLDKIIKAGTTVATITSTALTIYNNADRIKNIYNTLRTRN